MTAHLLNPHTILPSCHSARQLLCEAPDQDVLDPPDLLAVIKQAGAPFGEAGSLQRQAAL
jgi:hypothetical protein